MSLPKKLTERERRFVEAFVGEAAGNGAKAACLAGYAKGSAKVTASKLLTKANVRAALTNLQEKAARASIADAVERDEILSKLLRSDAANPLVRIKAISELNKCHGRHVTKHEHSGPGGTPIQVITGVPQPDDAHV